MTWNIEMNSPNNLMLLGWKRSTVKPGDEVTITVHPLKGDKAGGSFMSGDARQRHEDQGLIDADEPPDDRCARLPLRCLSRH